MTATTPSEVGISRFLTLEQASELSTLSVQTLRRAIQRQRLRAFRPSGRRVLIAVEDLSAWIRGSDNAQREPEGTTD